jgi:hypothetical protein
VITLVAAAALIAFVFVTSGGLGQTPDAAHTWAEIVLIALAGAAAIAVIVLGAPGPAWGAVTLALFAAVAALTAISIAWSIVPDQSWLSANQTLSYVAVFGIALVLGRLFPERWPALLGAIAIAATVVSAYALLLKVFPGSLDASDTYGRLSAPFDYWNATGLMAALGLPACVWAGAAPESRRLVRALVVPAISILVAVVVLSISRGAVAAAVIGLGCWFVLAPLRLRGLLVLALGGAGGAAIAIWALAHHALSRDHQALASRTHAGHEFGVVLLVVLAAMTAIGVIAAIATERVSLDQRVRRWIGTAAVTAVALVPLVLIVALAASSRGLTGEVSHIWTTLTNPNGSVSNNPDRLVDAGSSRALYWSQAAKVGAHAPLAGTGADAFGTARLRYTTNPTNVANAHGYVVQTFSDFGALGLALNLALLIAWALAAARTVRHGPADRMARDRTEAERVGMVTMLATVIVFGVHSTVDWTWFFPGTTVIALACAGWLAGRGPLSQRIGLAPHRKRLTANPVTGAATVAIVAVTVIAAWAVWQPLRSFEADASAVSADVRGDGAAALTDARTAASTDPVAVEPLFTLAAIYQGMGQPASARRELQKAVNLQPDNPTTWLQLGEFDLASMHQPGLALAELRRALSLDLTSTQAVADITIAQQQLQQSAHR